MNVKINIPPFLSHLVNVEAAAVNGRTVGECLKDLVEQFPQLGTQLFTNNGRLFKYLEVYINGKSAYPNELAKQVNDGDELNIVNIICGG